MANNGLDQKSMISNDRDKGQESRSRKKTALDSNVCSFYAQDFMGNPHFMDHNGICLIPGCNRSPGEHERRPADSDRA